MKQERNILMVFMKNPEMGKVKTRLASSIGPEKALRVYTILLAHTKSVIKASNRYSKAIFYSDYINDNDLWNETSRLKFLQHGRDLGEKIKNAFASAFENRYKNIVVIGTDCYDLNADIIEQAFDKLQKHEVVLGPAQDGGYYLLGMNSRINLFENIPWSTDQVLKETINTILAQKKSYCLLPQLSDIDTEQGLKRYKTLYESAFVRLSWLNERIYQTQKIKRCSAN